MVTTMAGNIRTPYSSDQPLNAPNIYGQSGIRYRSAVWCDVAWCGGCVVGVGLLAFIFLGGGGGVGWGVTWP